MSSPAENQRMEEQPAMQPPSCKWRNWQPTGRSTTASRAADVLVFAAAPTFAVMAWLSATSPAAGVLCSAAPDASIDDMTLMYLLMSAVHAAPWMKRIAGRRGAARRP